MTIDLEKKLDDQITQLSWLTVQIKRLEAKHRQLGKEIFDEVYLETLISYLNKYRKVSDETIYTLREYFEIEKLEQRPAKFVYWQLYKRLTAPVD